MKLSEFGPSLYHSTRLRLISAKTIKQKATEQLPLVVSLTTIPTRLGKVALTVRSLLKTRPQPQKIVLWLNDQLQDTTPSQLSELQGDVFEIRYSPYTFSHRKLIHSLEAFPEATIVTVDDDMIYHPHVFDLLYKCHLKYPETVIANRIRYISYDDTGNVLPYLQWPHVSDASESVDSMMPVGACGVLYPPGVFDQRVTDVDLIQKISPKSDDLWFKTMALLRGTKARLAPEMAPDPIPIMGSQKVALKKINNKQDYKRVQWERIAEYFDINLK